MTKPEDIPQDVWDAATAVRSEAILSIAAWIAGGMTEDVVQTDALDVIFARAILAAKAEERELCARVAERDGSSHDATFSQQTPEWRHDTGVAVRTADRIAGAIRKRGEATKLKASKGE